MSGVPSYTFESLSAVTVIGRGAIVTVPSAVSIE